MFLLPFIELRADVLEPLGGLSDLFCLGFGFFLVTLLLESVPQDIEQLKLHGSADLDYVSTVIKQ
jgi:hypothetical protein